MKTTNIERAAMKTKQQRSVNRVPLQFSIHWRYLHQDLGKKWYEIQRLPAYRKFSKATVCRHMNRAIGDIVIDKRKNNKGRPPKLSVRDHRNILRQAEILRNDYGYFTSKRLKVFAGIAPDVSVEAIRRVLRAAKFKYCHSRKKGVLTRNDLKLRLAFAKKVRARLSPTIWTDGIGFYLDGTGFTHKYNPYDQALAPRTMAWRKPSDGLKFQQTAKGSHEGSGGKVAHFLVAIAHDRGVILAEQYEGHLNGQQFADFVRNKFPGLFEASANSRGKLFLQDGDPAQNSRKALDAMFDVGARKFSIPARSPDLNPIENVFNNVKAQLRDDAFTKNIKWEDYPQFCKRVNHLLLNFPSTVIDKTIASMEKRINVLIKAKGQRIKY